MKRSSTAAVFLILLMAAFVLQVDAFTGDHPWKKLSRPEKTWSAFHPFKARKSYHCAIRARAVTDSLEKAGTLTDKNGGQLDAFRHAYWMALMINEGLSEKMARRIGKNHEKGNYLSYCRGELEDSARTDSMACVMDLRNNDEGIRLGEGYRKGDRKLSLIQQVINQVWNGRLFILKKNANGEYLDCEGKRIDLALYRQKWYVPKCIVGSDKVVPVH